MHKISIYECICYFDKNNRCMNLLVYDKKY